MNLKNPSDFHIFRYHKCDRILSVCTASVKHRLVFAYFVCFASAVRVLRLAACVETLIWNTLWSFVVHLKIIKKSWWVQSDSSTCIRIQMFFQFTNMSKSIISKGCLRNDFEIISYGCDICLKIPSIVRKLSPDAPKPLRPKKYPSVTLTRRGLLGNAVWKLELRNFNLVTWA